MRADMAHQQKQLVEQLAWETRQYVASIIVAIAAAIGAGVGIGNLIWSRQPPPQTIIIQQPAPSK